eukprot:scaffold43088_cov64-Phaeocystis_antarctica.AAC.3
MVRSYVRREAGHCRPGRRREAAGGVPTQKTSKGPAQTFLWAKWRIGASMRREATAWGVPTQKTSKGPAQTFLWAKWRIGASIPVPPSGVFRVTLRVHYRSEAGSGCQGKQNGDSIPRRVFQHGAARALLDMVESAGNAALEVVDLLEERVELLALVHHHLAVLHRRATEQVVQLHSLAAVDKKPLRL